MTLSTFLSTRCCYEIKYFGERIVLKICHKVNTVKVLLCENRGWIFTHGLHSESFTTLKSWLIFHPLCMWCKSSSLKVLVNFRPWCMEKKSFIAMYGEGFACAWSTLFYWPLTVSFVFVSPLLASRSMTHTFSVSGSLSSYSNMLKWRDCSHLYFQANWLNLKVQHSSKF